MLSVSEKNTSNAWRGMEGGGEESSGDTRPRLTDYFVRSQSKNTTTTPCVVNSRRCLLIRRG